MTEIYETKHLLFFFLIKDMRMYSCHLHFFAQAGELFSFQRNNKKKVPGFDLML